MNLVQISRSLRAYLFMRQGRSRIVAFSYTWARFLARASVRKMLGDFDAVRNHVHDRDDIGEDGSLQIHRKLEIGRWLFYYLGDCFTWSVGKSRQKQILFVCYGAFRAEEVDLPFTTAAHASLFLGCKRLAFRRTE